MYIICYKWMSKKLEFGDGRRQQYIAIDHSSFGILFVFTVWLHWGTRSIKRSCSTLLLNLLNMLWISLRVCSFGVFWSRISDRRSLWIMVHQKNRWIHDQSGFTAAFNAACSRQILDHWFWSRSPKSNAPQDTVAGGGKRGLCQILPLKIEKFPKAKFTALS